MHEVAIMTEALRMAEDAARTAGGIRITRVRLRVGSLSGVVPEALQFAFEAISPETLAAGAVLEVERVSAAGWCAVCQAEFECADFFNECPKCHNPGGELRRGRELDLAAVELE
jgi:hydrogenase nickel incorporation protein HypA/HybF